MVEEELKEMGSSWVYRSTGLQEPFQSYKSKIGLDCSLTVEIISLLLVLLPLLTHSLGLVFFFFKENVFDSISYHPVGGSLLGFSESFMV